MDLTTAYTDSSYRQPDPVQRPADRRPTNEQWVLIAAVWLLSTWSPRPAAAWAPVLVSGRTSSRQDRQWPEPPAAAEIAVAADLPEATGATVLTSRVSPGPGQSYQPARTDAETAAELVTLISHTVAVPDRRAESLVRFLAEQLAGPYCDLLRLTTGTEGPLHLLHRDTYGNTLRVSLNPAVQVEPPPSFAADGPDAVLRTRIACVMTLLSDMLWLNNSSPVTFRFRIGRLDDGDGDPMAAAARWWSEIGEESDEDEFRPVSAADLRAGIRILVRMHLSELFDGEWSGIEEFPEVPDGHISTFLADELADLVLARLGDDPQVAVAGFLPVAWPPPEEGLDDDMRTTVLLVAGAEVASLEIDLVC
ncbi:hypothetical protein F4553_000692 [Allocatelliglobosispora scoriae]|uniref:Uncharacterized protein n=1 Tax=Allocatelliglobosispora scoriae TaxID=643052 RepID=A0A841BJW7_9ACTN|nr:hypothetical protein [Allocatelliglobosispora scoriae]MBB5867313.1 hypothetical protein [Allocatelliglobosispora scoriae]